MAINLETALTNGLLAELGKRGQAPFFNKISLIKKYDKIKKTR